MRSRRNFLSVFVCAMLPVILFAPTAAIARRGRVRIGGRGISAGTRHSGPTLSQAQLKQCVISERSINSAMDRLDHDEAYINQQQAHVNQYSQQSVDRFNALVEKFNAEGARANAQVDSFNSTCANRAYYESDMRAVQTASVVSSLLMFPVDQ